MTDTAETATPDTETSTTEQPAPSLEDQLTAAQAEIDKWQKNSRKNEQRAKDNAAAAKELAEFKKQAMTDTERAIAEATETVRAETIRTMGARLVAAEFRAATAGTGVDVDVLLEGVDPGRFVADDGEVDTKAISAFVERLVPKPAEQPGPVFGDFGQTAGKSRDSTALNGDPLLRDLKRAIGAT